MRLWVDGQCLQTASRERGIGRYVLGLLSELAKRPELEIEVSFNAAMPDALLMARNMVTNWIPAENIHAWQGIAKAGEASHGCCSARQASEIALAHHVSCIAPDLALVPSVFEGISDVATPLLANQIDHLATACIVYDLIPFHYPDRFMQTATLETAYSRRLQALCAFPTALAISDFTKQDLLGFGYQGHAFAIGAGLDQRFAEIQNRPRTLDRSESYLLYVGGLDPHKNVKLVGDALVLLPLEVRRGLRFKVAGSESEPHKRFLSEYFSALNLPPDTLSFEGHVSDERLAELYANAKALVHPSLMEGFGLTALEAMNCGTPVVCSGGGALMEVVGDSGLHYIADSASHLADALQVLLTSPALVQDLRSRGQARAQQFSWARSAALCTEALLETPKLKGCDNPPDLDALRNRARAAIAPLDLSLKDKIGLMSVAEPPPRTPRKLVIDATETLGTEARTGIQRVVKSICTELAQADSSMGVPVKIAFCKDLDGWYEVEIEGDFYETASKKELAKRLFIGNRDVLLLLDSSWEYHAVHGTAAKRARHRGGTVVSCLYDFVPLKAYAFCHSGMPAAFSKWFAASLTYSDAYVCISRAVADELYHWLEAIEFPRPMAIGYWHLGADIAVPSATNPPQEVRRRPRFLMVGTIEPRKGYDVALAACEMLWASGVEFELIIVGRAGWNVSHLVQHIREHPEFGHRLRWLDDASDLELAGLYGSCDALIASSYAEGFGLPIVEARHYGKPAILSDLEVFREVAGEGSSMYFPVGSSTGLASAIRGFIDAPSGGYGSPPREWVTWKESAETLKRMVLGGRWYKTYTPNQTSLIPMSSAFDLVGMKGALDIKNTAYEVRLVSGPIPSPNGTGKRYVVSVTNLSSHVWSSQGRFPVSIGYGAVRRDESEPKSERLIRVSIPFVMAPGEPHYVPLDIPANDTGDFLHVRVVQESLIRLGNPLNIPLR